MGYQSSKGSGIGWAINDEAMASYHVAYGCFKSVIAFCKESEVVSGVCACCAVSWPVRVIPAVFGCAGGVELLLFRFFAFCFSSHDLLLLLGWLADMF